MAVDLSKLAIRNKIGIDELNGKTIAIDAYNVLYQFLSIIRQPDGTPLHDSHGEVTSHLSGIFYRTIEMVEHGINPIYVFDGLPSKLKSRTISARIKRRSHAHDEWQKAKSEGNMELARSYAEQSSRVDKAIVDSSKSLLDYMGIPYINAPSEGEAQASYMCGKGLVYATGSQDYDTLLFGSERVVRNLTLSGRRKLPRKNIYVNISTEMMNLDETLSSLGISRNQLIWIGIMLGTDFNTGVKGVGPKTALKISKSVNSLDGMVSYIKKKYETEFDVDVHEVEDLFLNPEVKKIDDEEIQGMISAKPDVEALTSFMCDAHDFDRERISKFAKRLAKESGASNQSGIHQWM